jgi:signal transduction histidine kinase
VLIAGRRRDRPFTQGEVEQLEELGAIATLLIRNSRLLAEAASSSRAKSSFINLAAHELGTPISVIRGYIDMLADESLGELSDRQRAAIDMVRMTSADLGERVEQLLVASRLEAGAPVIRDQSPMTDIVKAVREAVDRATPRATLMDAELTTALPPHPLEVRCTDSDAAVILDNLLNNALTYSKHPARAWLEVREGEPVEVRVLDHGIGIPEEARDRIFDQFYRVDDVEFGYPSGTGLGLYISRQLAVRNGGDLLLERSGHGEGSVFLLRLARATA